MLTFDEIIEGLETCQPESQSKIQSPSPKFKESYPKRECGIWTLGCFQNLMEQPTTFKHEEGL